MLSGVNISYMKILAKSICHMGKFWLAHNSVGVEEEEIKCFPRSHGTTLPAWPTSSNVGSPNLWLCDDQQRP